MDEIAADVGPQTPMGQVQGDSFCAHCNYNLFSQVIFMDERLKIAVCRCPECGGFTAGAALGMAAGRAQHRVAIGQVVVYVLFLLVFFGIGAGILFAFQFNAMDAANYSSDDIQYLAFWGGLFACAGGISVVSFLWHIPRRWHPVFLIVPLLAALICWNTRGVGGHPSYTEQKALFLVVAVEISAMAVGLLFGRFIARGLLALLLPMGVRRYLGFLWLVDGKSPPGTSVTSSSGGGTQMSARTASAPPAEK